MTRNRLAVSAFALFAALGAEAGTLEFKALLDTDNNAATGCTVATFTGVEQVLTTTVSTTDSAGRPQSGTVTGVVRQVCEAGTLGAPISVSSGGWGIGIDGASGNIHVETLVPLAALVAPPAMLNLRTAFLIVSGNVSSSALTQPNGDGIIYPPTGNRGRRRASEAPGEERVIVLDGNVDDWTGLSPLVPTGGTVGTLQFHGIYLFASAENLFFRFDAKVDISSPTALNDSYSIRQGQTLSVPAPGVLGNDNDPNGLPLTAIGLTSPTSGILNLQSNGGFTYIHNGLTTASDAFQYRASNGTSLSNPATVTINVTPNGAPVARNDAYSVAHRGTLTVPAPGVLANDSDPDGDRLTARNASTPRNGTVVLNTNGSFTYTHNGSNTLTDSFTYQANDGISADIARVDITIAANFPPVAVGEVFTVAEGATLAVAAPGLLANDTDVDTPVALLRVVSASTPANGTLTANADGSFTYVHNGGESTSDSFTYQVSDGIALSAAVTVTIAITPVNDTPVAVNDAYATDEDVLLNVAPPGVLSNDTDAEGTALTASVVTTTTNGVLTPNANGGFTYQPNANFNGSDSFTYQANDGTASSNTATVTITVNAVNDQPSFTDAGAVTILEDAGGTGAHSSVWATAIVKGPADESGQTVTLSITGLTNPALFATPPSIAPDGTLTFTTAANQSGTATATVTMQDNGGTALGGVDTSVAHTLTINVTSVNDAPSFTKGADQTVNEDAGAQTVNGWATAISAGPADEAGQALTFNASNDNNALFSAQPAISATGDLTYTAAANANGSATVTITLSDNGGVANGGADTSAAQTLVINVTAVNDEPAFTVGANPTVDEDAGTQTINGWATAISAGPANESQTLTFTVTQTGGALTFAIAPAIDASGNLTFTPTSDANGTATFNVVLTDSGSNTPPNDNTSPTASFTITVNAVNDAPSFEAPANASSNEDNGPTTISGFASSMSPGPIDENGQTLTFNVTVAAIDPTLSFSSPPAINATTGDLTFTANAEAFGTATLSVTLSDNGSNVPPNVNTSAAHTVTLTINQVNDEPSFTIVGNPPPANEDSGAQTVNNFASLISAGPNEGSQTLTFIVTPVGTTGTLTFSSGPSIDAAGTLTYTTTGNTNGTATFSAVLTDNGSGTPPNDNTSAPQAFTITVNAVNDPPSFTVPASAPASNEDTGAQTVNGFATSISPGPSDEVTAGQTVSFNVTVTGSDPTLTFLSAPAIDNSGNLTYTANANAFGTATVSVTATDNGSGVLPNVNTSGAQTFTITVNNVNDAPVVTASGGTTAFVEDAGAVAVDGGLTVTDIDSANLASATVTIANLLDVGQETLSAPTLLGSATASYVAPTLTISGAATVAEYQMMLRAVTYDNSSNNPNTTTRTMAFQADDGGAVSNLSNVSNKSVSVANTNDAPVVTASGGPTAFTEDGGAVVVDGGVTVTDVDSANIASATVTITNLVDAGQESLAASLLLGGATANYVAPTLTISGSTTLANYQAMLQAVTYSNTSQNPTTTNRTLAFQVDDGAGVNNLSNVSNKTVSIVAVNDAPVVTASGGTTAFVEDAGAVAVDGAITVTDIDSTNLASATITITNLLDAGVETLAAPTLLGGATANYNAPTLTISGAATVAEYQTMLRAVTYDNASNNPNTTNRTIRFQVDDGGGVNNLSNQSDKTLSVAAANDAPMVTTSGGTTAFTEDGGAVVVDNGVTVTDVDNTNLASATVTITNLLDAGVEVLAAPTLLGGVTANYVAPTLTLTGSASLADYQTILQAITYNNTSQNPTTTNRTLAFVVNDGATNSAASNKTVSIAAVNDAPVVTASGGTTAFVEDGPAVAVDGAITVTDIDSANLASATVTITNLLDAGVETLAAPTLLGAATASYVAPTLTISGAATVAQYQTMLQAVTYINASNQPNTTNRTIRFQVDDGAGVNNLSNQSDKTLSVAASNDAPVVTTTGGTVTFTEAGGAITIDSGVSVTDVDSATIASATITITNLLDAGQETLAAPTLLGGATANYVAPTLTISGTTTLANYQTMLQAVTYNNSSTAPNPTQRSIGFQVNDGGGVNNLSNTATKDVVVISVNSQPVVTTSGGTTAFVEDGPAVAIDGGLTVTDPDSTNLTQATVTISNLLDPGLETLSAPTLLGGATANYVAPTLTISGTTTVANYQTMLRAVTYNNASNTPNVTNRTISFQVDDGQPSNNLSNVASKTVSVAANNDAPVVATSGGTTGFTEDGGAVVVDNGVTVSDVDSANIGSATITISNLLDAGVEVLAAPTLLGGATANYVAPTLTITGSTSLANYQAMLQAVTYNNTSQNPNATNRTINFQINDGAANSNIAGKTVSIAAVNDAPVVTASGGTTAFVEDTPAVAIDGALTVTDVDSANLTQATITITNLLDAGLETLSAPTLLGGATANYVAPTLTISGSTTVANYQTMLRAVTYSNASNTPNTTNRTIAFQVNDGAGVNNLSNVSNKTVSVTPTNDPPVVTSTGGTSSFTEDLGAIVVDSGVTVTDVDSANIASATITITNLLDAGQETLAAPTLLNGATANYVAPTLTITGSATLAQYQTMLQAVTYDNASQNPTTTSRVIRFVVNDGAVNSNNADKTVTIAAVNDASVVTTTGTTTSFTEDGGAVAVDNLITVTDVDSTNLTQATITITNIQNAGVELLAAPTLLGGATANYVAPTLTISGSTTVSNYETMLRAVTYNNTSQDPNTTTRVISFQVNDGGAVNNLSNTPTKNVSVTAVNDAPIPANVTVNGISGVPVNYQAGTLSGTDVEAGTTVTIDTVAGTSSLVGLVSATVSVDGSFSIVPIAGFVGNGAASFQYKVKDNGNPGPGVSSTAFGTVTINLNGSATYFVRSVGVGLSNCTLGTECTLPQAVAAIGVQTNKRIFISDANTSAGPVPLTQDSWLIGQGVTGVDFATVMGYNAAVSSLPAGATRPFAFPAINQTRPTVGTGAVTLHNNSNARGFNISVTGANSGLVSSGKTGLVVDLGTVATSNGTATPTWAVDLSTSSGTQFNFGNITGGGSGANSHGVRFSTTSTTTVTFGTINTTNGKAFDSTGTGATSFTFGNITSAAGAAVTVATSTGSFTFANVNSTTGAAVTTSGTGAGTFGFGTVTSTTGAAVSVATATGAYSFTAINANGATTGISVSGLAAPGSFIVNGSGTTDGSGGTLQNCTTRGASFISSDNITLKNMNLTGNGTSVASPNANCADGLNASISATNTAANCQSNLHLQTVSTVSLDNLDVLNSKQNGINGHNVTNITMNNLTVTGNGDEVGEDGIQLANLKGASNTLTNSTVRNNAARSVEVQNNATGAVTFIITGGTFGNTTSPTAVTTPSTSTAADTILMATNGLNSASLTSVIKGTTISNIFGRALNSNTEGNTSQNVSFGTSGVGNGNTVSNVSYGTDVNGTTSNSVTYTITNNTFTNTANAVTSGSRTVINARKGFGATGGWVGTVTNNLIGVSGVAESGCDAVTCGGISLDNAGVSGNHDVIVTGNTINRVNGHGIFVSNNPGSASTGTMRATILGNTIGSPDDGTAGAGGNQGSGIFVSTTGAGASMNARVGGSLAADKNNVTGNYGTGGGGTLRGVRYSRGTDTIFCIANYSGPFDSTSVGNHITTQNTGNAGSATQSVSDSPARQFSGPSCPTP